MSGIGLRKVFFLALSATAIFSSTFADELYLFSGAGLRKPMDRIITQFEKQTGSKVVVSYGGAGKLYARYLSSRKGDLFIPGAYFYIDHLKKEGLVLSDKAVVYHTPVVAVHRDGRAGIDTFQDLKNKGLRIAIGDPKAMAFGRTAMEILEKSGMKDEILENVVVYGATVNQLTLYLVKRTVDASIIGRSNVFLHRDTLRIVEIPEAYYTPEIIAIAVLKTTSNRELAQGFQRFTASPEGIEQFKQMGFIAIEK